MGPISHMRVPYFCPMHMLNMTVGTNDIFEEISLTDKCDDNDESIDSPEVFTYEIPSRPKLFKMLKKTGASLEILWVSVTYRQ